MPTNFPTGLDTLVNPTASDEMDDPGVEHDLEHSNANDAIEELEKKVGVNGSAVATSLERRLKIHTHNADDGGLIGTGALASDGVTFQKLQNVAASRLLGRSSPGTGDVEEITVGSGLDLAGGVLTSSGGGGGGLDGLQSANDFGAAAAVPVFLNPAAEPGSTAGWTADAGGLALDSVDHSPVNTKAIKANLSSGDVNSRFFWNSGVGSEIAVGPAQRIIFWFEHEVIDSQATMGPGKFAEFVIADGQNLSGNIVTIDAPRCLGPLQWYQISVLLVDSGITQIGSFGIRHRSDSPLFGGSTTKIACRFGYGRCGDATGLEVAVVSAAGNSIVVPQDYAGGSPAVPILVPDSRTVVELRPGLCRITREGGARSVREFYIPGDLSRDVSQDVAWALQNMNEGEVLELDPAGKYAWSGTVIRDMNNKTIEGFGRAAIVQTTPNLPGGALFTADSDGIVFSGLRLFGFRQFKNGQIAGLGNTVATSRFNFYNECFDDFELTHQPGIWGPGTNVRVDVQQERSKIPGGQSLTVANNNTIVQDCAVVTPTGTAGIRVEPSVGYTFEGSFLPDNTSNPSHLPATQRNVQLEISWWKADGTASAITPVSTQAPVAEVAPDINGVPQSWVDLSFAATSPADAAYASFAARILAVAAKSGANREGHCVDRFRFRRTAARALANPTVAIVSIVEGPAGTYTVVTATPHDLYSGQNTTMAGNTPAGYNATKSVTRVNATTFTFTGTAAIGALTVAGTATSGRISLDQPGDETELTTARTYGRDVDGKIRVDFEVSGTGNVAETVELRFRSKIPGHIDEILYEKQVVIQPGDSRITLELSRFPHDLRALEMPSVRRITKNGTGSIDVHSYTEYRPNKFDTALESASGILFPDTHLVFNATVRNCLVEGFGGDGFTIHGGTNIHVYDSISRACSRQGIYLDGGDGCGYHNIQVYGAGRSGIDMEPTKAYQICRNPVLEDIYIYDPTINGMAMTPWARVVGLRVNGFYAFDCPNGGWDGGGRDGYLERLVFVGCGASIRAKNTVVQGIVGNAITLVGDTGSDYYDDNGNHKSLTGTGIRVYGAHVWDPAGGGLTVTGVNDNQFCDGPNEILTPAQLAANANNYNPAMLSTAGTVRLSSDASRTITGLVGGWSRRRVVLVNVGSFDVVLSSDDAASTDINRFTFVDTQVLQPNAALELEYDVTSLRWRLKHRSPINRVRKVADEAVASSTTLQDDDHLKFLVKPNGVVFFEAFLRVGGVASGEVKFGWTVPGTSTMEWGTDSSSRPMFENVAPGTDPDAALTAAGTMAFGVSNAGFGIVLQGFVFADATGGLVTLRWAQNISSPNAITVKQHSFIRITPVS